MWKIRLIFAALLLLIIRLALTQMQVATNLVGKSTNPAASRSAGSQIHFSPEDLRRIQSYSNPTPAPNWRPPGSN